MSVFYYYCNYCNNFINFVIQHGANVNAMDLWQFTPLHEASSKNRGEVCSLLLANGADPSLFNCHSKNAMDVAASKELADKIQCESYDMSNFALKNSTCLK